MTRLSEALERAEAAKGATTTAARTGEPVRDVPSDWKFQEAEVRPAQEVRPEPPSEPPPVTTPMAPPAPTTPTAAAPVASRAWLTDDAAAKLVVGQRDNLLVEQFRRLAAVLHHSQQQRHTRTAMIASAVPAEGKSLTATNLALTLSRSYEKRVLLIDADLRRPTLHTLLNASNGVGLRTSLTDPRQARLPVVQVDEKLWLLPAGRPDPNPTSLVTSPAMKQLIADAAEQFDWVIIDTPPVGLMPDANLLAAMVEVAFVVVNAGQTPYPLVKKAVEAIGIERVLGVVLNRADRGLSADAYSYYDYYADGARNSASGRKRFALG
jgi:receptor protein-tyrosine kinase